MEIVNHLAEGTYCAAFQGKFIFSDHLAFRDILKKVADADVGQVVFDVKKLEFVDSAALGMLLLALDEAEKHHKKLILRGAGGQVKKMFDMARFNTLFTVQEAS